MAERYYVLQLGLSLIGTIWYGIIWSIGLLGCWTARKRYRSRPSPISSTLPSSAPGLDTNLFENLESSFMQDYPNFEILLSVADERDEALPVYPNVNARVIIGDEEVGVNPKVNNLIRPYGEAAHDILWVSTLMSRCPWTLTRAIGILSDPPSSHPNPRRRRIALVHHVPFAISSQVSFGAQVEEAFLNTNHAKMYIAINAVAVDSCVQAGSGLAAFGRFIAEDNMIGLALWHELDLRHSLSRDVAYNALGEMSLTDYVWRRVRWIRVRKHMSLLVTLLEPFTESVMLSAVTAMSVRFLMGVPIRLFLPVHFFLWFMVDLDVYASLAGHSLPVAKWRHFLVAWVVRELLAFPIWALAVVGNEVQWRGRRYRVLRNGEAERIRL
ncbi:glycosyltransferase family 21 protein [Russula vinacea]|nr:glycosyltransferase family 21 protein [Russula vinacea]